MNGKSSNPAVFTGWKGNNQPGFLRSFPSRPVSEIPQQKQVPMHDLVTAHARLTERKEN